MSLQPTSLHRRASLAKIEARQSLVNANRELIRRMEAKVKAAIDRVWAAKATGSIGPLFALPPKTRLQPFDAQDRQLSTNGIRQICY